MYVHICMSIHVDLMHVYVYICIYVYYADLILRRIYIHTYIYVYIYIYVYVYIYIYFYIAVYLYRERERERERCVSEQQLSSKCSAGVYGFLIKMIHIHQIHVTLSPMIITLQSSCHRVAAAGSARLSGTIGGDGGSTQLLRGPWQFGAQPCVVAATNSSYDLEDATNSS